MNDETMPYLLSICDSDNEATFSFHVFHNKMSCDGKRSLGGNGIYLPRLRKMRSLADCIEAIRGYWYSPQDIFEINYSLLNTLDDHDHYQFAIKGEWLNRWLESADAPTAD